MSEAMGKDELIALAKEAATPIDFVELEQKGLIEKKGAWYKVKSIHALPKSVSSQIRAVKTDRAGANLVQFPKSWTKAQRLYRKLTGKEYNE
jgi:hypothetical protein